MCKTLIESTKASGMIKLLALDLDGTLLCEGKMSECAKRAMNEVAQKGVKIAIVTGRSFSDVERVMRENGLPKHYPHALVCEEKFIFYLLDGVCKEHLLWNKRRREELEQLKREVGSLTYLWAQKIKENLAPLEEVVEEGMLFFAFSKREEAEEAHSLLQEFVKPFPLCSAIRNRNLVSLTLSTAKKGGCLLQVTKDFGIKREEVLAVGDSQNDEDMLSERAGFLVATTANADPQIKEVVRRRGGYVATKEYGEGVAEIIKEFL